MIFSKRNKLQRFMDSFKGVQPGRMGTCTPDKCETLDGRKGAACCKVDLPCIFLSSCNNCNIYNLRPRNCNVFPRTPDDLKLVKNCGYH